MDIATLMAMLAGAGQLGGGGAPPGGPTQLFPQQGGVGVRQPPGLGPRTIGAPGAGGAPPGLDPNAMGLLGLGGGMLNAAGPSRVPVGLGQGLMGGAMGGLGGMATANMMNRQSERDQLMDDFMRKVLGMAGGGAGGPMQSGGGMGGGGFSGLY